VSVRVGLGVGSGVWVSVRVGGGIAGVCVDGFPVEVWASVGAFARAGVAVVVSAPVGSLSVVGVSVGVT
jgi:hypothetical protein